MSVVPDEWGLLLEVGQEEQKDAEAHDDGDAKLADAHDSADGHRDDACGDCVAAMVEQHAERRGRLDLSCLFAVTVVSDLVISFYVIYQKGDALENAEETVRWHSFFFGG